MSQLLRARRQVPATQHFAALSPAARQSRAASSAAPTSSALCDSAKKLHGAFFGKEASVLIAEEADAPLDHAEVTARLAQELRAGEKEMEVFMLGEPLDASGPGRRKVVAATPIGPKGGPPAHSVSMTLPSAEDMARLLETRREQNPRVETPAELCDILEKYVREKCLGRRVDHVAMLAAWGPKSLADAEGEFAEILALMLQSVGAYRAALKHAKEDFQFEIQRVGDGRECLVMPPSNFALLGLKDAVHNMLEGFRVILVVQPRFFPHFREIQRDLAECGLPDGLVEVLPGITPEADPEVLHEVLKHVDRLQFTGSSPMFKSLVLKAYELGNLRMEYAGEVSGINKVRFDGVSAAHPAAATGAAWAAMANDGELCTSASMIEFDATTGDTAASVKAALDKHPFTFGRDIEDTGVSVLLKPGKTESLDVKTELPPGGFREWWEKALYATPTEGGLKLRTNQALGHCIYAPSIERAVSLGVQEDASCIYCVGVPSDAGAPSARAGTTGAKLPESVFGGMKTYTYAVAGDHDGVGSLQTLLNTVKRRGLSWRDQEEAYATYELTETAEMLLDFLNPREQKPFMQQVSNVMEIIRAFEPEVMGPYGGQPLVGAEGNSQLMTLTALKPSRRSFIIPRGVGLPEDIVKMAVWSNMSPLREVPADLHLVEAQQTGKLSVTDPLKSFLRVVEKQLGWNVHLHATPQDLAEALRTTEYPPYFFCVKDKHLLPVEVLRAVAEQGGYMYEGFPADALSLFRTLTATQAWTVACTEDQVAEAARVLSEAWKSQALREEPHAAPEITRPSRRNDDLGGGFNAGGMDGGDDKDWAELSSDNSSDSDGEAANKTATAAATSAAGTAPEPTKATGDAAVSDAEGKPGSAKP